MSKEKRLNKIRIESVYKRKSNRYLDVYNLIKGEQIGIRICKKPDDKVLGSIVVDLNKLKEILGDLK